MHRENSGEARSVSREGYTSTPTSMAARWSAMLAKLPHCDEQNCARRPPSLTHSLACDQPVASRAFTAVSFEVYDEWKCGRRKSQMPHLRAVLEEVFELQSATYAPSHVPDPAPEIAVACPSFLYTTVHYTTAVELVHRLVEALLVFGITTDGEKSTTCPPCTTHCDFVKKGNFKQILVNA
eukprot:1176223-Prorocentrum_minimum.AAC.13